MTKKTKNLFSKMQSIIRKGMAEMLCMTLLLLLTATGCNKQEANINQDDLISSNLLKNGDIDSTSLVGEWKCIKFAYTTNGDAILDVASISTGNLTIPIASTPIENTLEDRWCLSHTNQNWYICSLSNNLIDLIITLNGSTYVMPSLEEIDITFALENAYSFVIRDDELIIYFRGGENKNLLILKRKS